MKKTLLFVFMICFFTISIFAQQSNNDAPAGFVRITGGTFMMGIPDIERFPNSDQVLQQQVTVSSFLMGIYPVTQKEYFEIMGVNPSTTKGDNFPVTDVSWFDAIEYCNLRSHYEGLTLAYTITGTGNNRVFTYNRNATGYRLPTEAEWEYACRAETTTPLNTGIIIKDNIGWYNENSGGRLQSVGLKSANAWGLYDMHGNVWEWCYDWFGTYQNEAQTNPVGASSGSWRVLRGGSWASSAAWVGSAVRFAFSPTYRRNDFGFRLVRP